MREASANLIAFLDASANRTALIADVYTFALADGLVLRYSGWDTALTVPAASFPTGSLNVGAQQTFNLGPTFSRSRVTTKVGIEPSELDIQIGTGPSDQVGTLSLAEAVQFGLFEGATVELDKVFSASGPGTVSYNTPGIDTGTLGAIIWFYGQVADVNVGRSRIDMKVKSLLNKLQIGQFPRRIYQPACNHVFGGTMCGYDRVNGLNALGTPTGVGQFTATATTGTTQNSIVTTSTISANYVEGTVVCATGANAGIKRTISQVNSSNTLILWFPYPFTVVNGDTFFVLPGCDHTTATCNGVFQNILRFGGFPYVPPPEMAI